MVHGTMNMAMRMAKKPMLAMWLHGRPKTQENRTETAYIDRILLLLSLVKPVLITAGAGCLGLGGSGDPPRPPLLMARARRDANPSLWSIRRARRSGRYQSSAVHTYEGGEGGRRRRKSEGAEEE